MGRPKTVGEKVRLNLETTKVLRGRIEKVMAMCEAETLTETVRRAVILFEVLLEARDLGARIIIRHGKGEKEILIS